MHSSIAVILMGKRELVALLNLSPWCLVMVEWLFLAVRWGCLQVVIVVFPDHTHLLFLQLSCWGKASVLVYFFAFCRHMAVSILCFFSWCRLQYAIVSFSGHRHLLFNYQWSF